MPNDYKGVLEFEGVVTFFASGSKGKEVRANGRGGFLDRGYYWTHEYKNPKAVTYGPFSTRQRAWRNSGIDQSTTDFYVRGRRLREGNG